MSDSVSYDFTGLRRAPWPETSPRFACWRKQDSGTKVTIASGCGLGALGQTRFGWLDWLPRRLGSRRSR